MTMAMTKIRMLTNERNCITKRENDQSKRNAKPFNEKDQVPREQKCVHGAHLNGSDQSSINLQNRTEIVTCL